MSALKDPKVEKVVSRDGTTIAAGKAVRARRSCWFTARPRATLAGRRYSRL